MTQSAAEDHCALKGCGHLKSAHVHDHVMHEGAWINVSRCLECEAEGGPCTDAARILPDAS